MEDDFWLLVDADFDVVAGVLLVFDVVDFEESSVFVVLVVALFEVAAELLSVCFTVCFVLADPLDEVVVLLVDVWFAEVDVLFDVEPHPASPSEANKMIEAAKGFTLKVMLLSPFVWLLYLFGTHSLSIRTIKPDSK